MLVNSRGIVLSQLKYGDSSLIVNIYTEKNGKKSFLIKGIRSKKSKVRINLFSPLNILNLSYYEKEGKSLYILKEVSYYTLHKSLGFNPSKSLQVMFLAEVLHHCLKEELADPDLFDFLMYSISYFDMKESHTANFHLSFLMKLTKYLGILPSVNDKNEINILDMKNGEFNHRIPDHNQYIGDETARTIHFLFVKNYDEGARCPLNRNQRNYLTEQILKFYDLHGYTMKNLNSFSVLKELNS